MLASVAIWTLLFSFKFSIAMVVSLFIHEYGHFYWMGKEGLKDRFMVFLPPLGAVAMPREPWTSYGAELRIALAGPIAGLLSVLLFYILWLVYPNDIFLASIALACLLNLFNLVFPVAILDGGRVIKSILYSIHQILGDGFYIVGFVLLGLAYIFGYFSLFFTILIGFGLYREWDYVRYARGRLAQLNKIKLASEGNPFSQLGEFSEELKSEYSKLSTFVNMKKMTWKGIVLGLLIFIGIILIYSIVFYWATGQIDFNKFPEYFK